MRPLSILAWLSFIIYSLCTVGIKSKSLQLGLRASGKCHNCNFLEMLGLI